MACLLSFNFAELCPLLRVYPYPALCTQITGARLAECDVTDGTAIFTGVALRGMSGLQYNVSFSGSTAHRDLLPLASVSDMSEAIWPNMHDLVVSNL